MHIDLIGVPLDLGAGRRGVDMGPSAIRYASLREDLRALGHTVEDRGNIEVTILETAADHASNLRYLAPIAAANARLADAVEASLRADHLPLVLGGDHSLAIGSISGAARVKKLGLIWIDAHGDFNTPDTTPSGNIHGMSVAALCGHGHPDLCGIIGPDRAAIDPANVAMVGIRDLDDGERELMRQAGIAVFAMDRIDCHGIYRVIEEAIAIATRGTEGIYLSLDLDALDPLYAPGVGTPVAGGLTFREAHAACELISDTGRLVGMDLVEVNPILDIANKTAELAVDLARSAMGKRIWRERR